MRRVLPAIVLVLTAASAHAAEDHDVMQRFCAEQWGTSAPLVESCIDAQKLGAAGLDILLADAAVFGWKPEVEGRCTPSGTSNYVTAAQCAAAMIGEFKWRQRDLQLARDDAWQKPEGVPADVFKKVKAQCLRDFTLSYSTIEICIDHRTREFTR